MAESTYIGPKGYTIYTAALEPAEQKQLKTELTVRPFMPKAPVQPEAFPIFRQSSNGQKLYVPRFYGLDTYGVPDGMRVPKGTPIAVPFEGDLRDYQKQIVEVYVKATQQHGPTYGGGGLLEIPCGRGKTVIALRIIAALKVKTLVIVHKSFLMSQWEERIAQFLPSAKVGKIQGPVIDIEGKDIVIGMLQSLSMKDYPEEQFASFGLTIVDECHHISSEVFCRSLQKIVTFYCLGLSATMERKDGLTKVFKMFLGPIVYSEQRDSKDPVLVKGVQFQVNDEEFNEIVYDYRGNPAYSTMITKLCAYGPRSEFILKVLQREMAAQAGQQIMILAHNRNLLTYLHDAIAHRQLATVGYYVGGMKEADLKATEECQVIVATYAMAAEALDIKTLTTLILATPKTDIVQAVGRILRVKHERPLVVDIIDSHDIFVQQWLKRRAYYVSNEYKILQTTSDKYMRDEWTEFKKRCKGSKPVNNDDDDDDDAQDGKRKRSKLPGRLLVNFEAMLPMYDGKK
jgi:superfamily II DNA or RNA helicase